MKAQDERKRVASSIASASEAIRWVRLSSPVSGSCRDSFSKLLVAGMAFIVDADDALGTRRLAVGTGEPAAGFLDPEHRLADAGAHAIFDPVRRALAAVRRRRMSQRVGADRARTARSVLKIRRRSPATPAGCPGKPRRHDRSRRLRRSRCPRRKPPGRARPGCSKLAEERMSRSPRFGTLPGDSTIARIMPCFRHRP